MVHKGSIHFGPKTCSKTKGAFILSDRFQRLIKDYANHLISCIVGGIPFVATSNHLDLCNIVSFMQHLERISLFILTV